MIKYFTFAFLCLSLKASATPLCEYAVQMFFAQDASGSFKNDIPNVRKNFPLIIAELAQLYPGSIYKLGSFTDVPMYPLGCIHEHDHPYQELTEWTADPAVMEEAFSNFRLHWGADYPEAQLMFMAQAALSGAFPVEKVTPEGRPFRRFLVMSTDDRYHVAGDSGFPESYYDYACEQHPECCIDPLPQFQRIPFQGDGVLRMPYELDGFWETEDYPKENDVPKWLADEDISLIFLISQGPSNKNWANWVSFVDKLHDNGVNAALVELDSESENLHEAIQEGMDQLEELFCPTEPAPATEAPTEAPTAAPTPAPTAAPTAAPTPAPTAAPTPAPTEDLQKTVTVDPIVHTENPHMTDAVGPITEPAVVPPPVGTVGIGPIITEPAVVPPPVGTVGIGPIITEPAVVPPPVGTDPAVVPSPEPLPTQPVVNPTDPAAPTEPTEGRTTTTATTSAAEEAGGVPVVVIGAAAGGAAAVAVAGVLAAKFAGVGAFGAQSPPTGQVLDNMDVPDAVEDREMIQEISGDMFE